MQRLTTPKMGWFGRNPCGVHSSILSLTVRDWQTTNSRLVTRLYDKLWGIWTTSAQAVPVTVLLQDAMPRVLMNTRPETRPTQYYHKLNARPKIAQQNTVGHESWSTNKRPKTKLHHTNVSKSEKSSTISQWIMVDSLRLSPHAKGWRSAAHWAA